MHVIDQVIAVYLLVKNECDVLLILYLNCCEVMFNYTFYGVCYAFVKQNDSLHQHDSD